MRHTTEQLKEKVAAREARKSLVDSDKDMARICEDLIEILLSKGIISDDDLPDKVKDKIGNRKELRGKV